jgi:uncharacterized membrane protein YfcA
MPSFSLDWITVEVLVVIFVATVIRSAFGFGEALVAVPLLALFIPVTHAVPLATLVSITVAAVVVAQDWRDIHVSSARWLILSTLVGIPLGILALTSVPKPIVKAVLAFIILAFSMYCILIRRPLELKTDKLAWFFGFAAGVLGGAYGMNGPPLVIYGVLRRWTPQQFRATLQGYFLIASLVGIVGYWLAGVWGSTVTRYYFLCLPLALVAVFLGRVVNRRLSSHRFHRYVYYGLVGIGTILFIQALSSKGILE